MKFLNKPYARPLYLAAVSTAIYAALLATVTWAFFTQENSYGGNNVSAGSIGMKTVYVSAEGEKINERGIKESYTRTFGTDLSELSEPLFNIEHAAPTVWQTSTISVTNTATVTFELFVSVKFQNADESTEADRALEQQITISVYVGNDAEPLRSFSLANCESTENKADCGKFYAGEAQIIKIKADFTERHDNNAAQNGKTNFGVLFEAVQST